MKLDYFETIKKAWAITWRHKYLWLLGFIVALSAGGSSFSNSSNYQTGAGDTTSSFGTQAGAFIEAYAAILIFLAIVFGLLGLIIWILSIISTGGLVGAAAKIEQGEKTSLSDALRIGAKNFWRILGLNIIVGLVIFCLIMIIIAPLIVVIAVMASGGNSGSAAPAGLICLVPVFILGLLVVAAVGVVLSVIALYATRYIVLERRGVFASISAGWRLIRSRFADTALMFLIVMVISALASLVFAIPGLIIGLPTILTLIAGIAAENLVVVFLASFGFMLLVLVMAFLNGVLEVFRSAVWTLTFMKISSSGESAPASMELTEIPPAPEAPESPEVPPAPPAPEAPAKKKAAPRKRSPKPKKTT